MKKHVILGNGGAAVSAICAIRSVSAADEIVVVSKEICYAYSPVLLTYYLSGRIKYDDIFIFNKTSYRKNNVKTILGKKAGRVNPARREVRLDDGSSIQYDDLLIATGASPLVPSIEGANLPGISPFWYADDARKVYDLANSAKQVAVVGAGFVGLQVLDCLLRQGKSIWLIETLDHLLPNVLDPGGAEIVLERLLQKGVHVHLKDKVYSIREAGKKKLLSITSGGTLKVDLVIFATGTRPNVDFLKRSGIKVSRGVIVDDYCRTSAEGIYAAGDVTESIDPVTEKVGANPTWPNAVEQGWTAGLNMAGREVTRRRRIRSNVFTISDLCCASVGLVSGTNKGYSEFVQKTGSTYRKLIFKDKSLVGAILVGDIEDAGVLNHFIELQKIFPESKIEMVKPDEIASVAGALCSWAGNHTQ